MFRSLLLFIHSRFIYFFHLNVKKIDKSFNLINEVDRRGFNEFFDCLESIGACHSLVML